MKIISTVFAYLYAIIYMFFALSLFTIPLLWGLGICMGW